MRNDRYFSHTNPYISNVSQQCQCLYFELGIPVVSASLSERALAI